MRYTMAVVLTVTLSGCGGAKSFLCAWGDTPRILPQHPGTGYVVATGQSYESCMGRAPKEVK